MSKELSLPFILSSSSKQSHGRCEVLSSLAAAPREVITWRRMSWAACTMIPNVGNEHPSDFKQPHEHITHRHSQAHHGVNYQIANCNFLEDNYLLPFSFCPARPVLSQLCESEFEDPLHRGCDTPPRDLGFVGGKCHFATELYLPTQLEKNQTWWHHSGTSNAQH